MVVIHGFSEGYKNCIAAALERKRVDYPYKPGMLVIATVNENQPKALAQLIKFGFKPKQSFNNPNSGNTVKVLTYKKDLKKNARRER